MALTRADHERRFWAKVEMTDGCWYWRGNTSRDGYGMVKQDNRGQLAHRIAYAWARGEIPAGLEIDHLCRVRCCVNPSHMEVVTREINMARSIARCAKITHCPRGHPYDGENTIKGSQHQANHRRCRTCHRDAETTRRDRSKGLSSH